MKKIEILKLTSLSRAPMIVEGYLFEGSDPDAPSVAVVGAMEGNTILPLYSASKLVDFLRNTLTEKKILGDILVVPSVNHYALNINERFWPLDKTDINMMFPGYDKGETTQRIAHKLFSVLQGYDLGIILETRSDLATCLPYVKLYKTGNEDLASARSLGLKIIHHREPESIETVSLQYNWQLWGTKACSIVCPHETLIDMDSGSMILDSLINFLSHNKIIDYETFSGFDSTVVTRKRIEIMQSPHSGIFIPTKKPGCPVAKDDTVGKIFHSLEGELIHRFVAPCDGLITCCYKYSLIVENAVAFRIARKG